MGLSYYPLKKGLTIIYDVDSTAYSDFNNTVTTTRFQLKDSITSSYIDIVGDTTYSIERYKKVDTEWLFQKELNRKITNKRAEEFIDNQRFVRMVFPQSIDKTWNGNLYNNDESWNYRIENIDEPLIINQIQIDSTLSIIQNNDINLISEIVFKETYAKHIGLVSKFARNVEKDINSGRVLRGYQYQMFLKSYH